ncbi:alpha/beta hydrolase [Prevotella falsenii]|uniref:alpha/beta hydrolase n=1 Tax=Prevotella falsenii TaxID=515414 RepID=UPI000469EDCA|nr:alpha/beta hydrolase [Prevotella falsenii]
MNKILSKNLTRYLCLTVAVLLSVSVTAQKDFSSIRTGVDVADAKIIESGVKSFKEIEKALPRRANSFDDDNPDHHATTGWGLNYEYYRYTYPSINTKGEPVTLTALAAMPTEYKVPISNIILGCHITITDNKSTPSEYIKSGDWKSDVGMLIMHARSKSASELAYNCLVILPDYQGYGITQNDAHPYLAQEITARQSVDALRYGIELYKNSKKGRAKIRDNWKTICVGYSQGGSVAMASHKFIETNFLDKDLQLGGSVCGDGPYDPIATLKFYITEDKIYMPVALPLIIKGMLDYNPYMGRHNIKDYFNEKFLNTGILDWIEKKEKDTEEIQKELKKIYDFKKDAKGEYIKVSEIFTPEAFAFMSKKVKGEATEKNPKFDDLYTASTVNNLTEGWKPKYPIYLFHSKVDEVVPLSNAESAYQKMRTDDNPNIIKYTYVEKGGHVKSGSTFYFALFGKCYEQQGVEAIAGGEDAWKKFNP